MLLLGEELTSVCAGIVLNWHIMSITTSPGHSLCVTLKASPSWFQAPNGRSVPLPLHSLASLQYVPF